jgi:hypothetical protein
MVGTAVHVSSFSVSVFLRVFVCFSYPVIQICLIKKYDDRVLQLNLNPASFVLICFEIILSVPWLRWTYVILTYMSIGHEFKPVMGQ